MFTDLGEDNFICGKSGIRLFVAQEEAACYLKICIVGNVGVSYFRQNL